ncbi:MAG: hypothetical protein KME13_25655 [Myxacorys californica WJT36-NPBG1]|nr:hypothetical protein [Myxacorys californica WJT36-NPBG1]
MKTYLQNWLYGEPFFGPEGDLTPVEEASREQDLQEVKPYLLGEFEYVLSEQLEPIRKDLSRLESTVVTLQILLLLAMLTEGILLVILICLVDKGM